MNEAENRKKLHEILDIVLDCNGLKARRRNKTGKLPTAYLSFYGNVACCDVTICAGGWYAGDMTPRTISVHTYEDISEEEIEKLREAVRKANVE